MLVFQLRGDKIIELMMKNHENHESNHDGELGTYRVIYGQSVSSADRQYRPLGIEGQRSSSGRRMQLQNGTGLESSFERNGSFASQQLIVTFPYETIAVGNDVH